MKKNILFCAALAAVFACQNNDSLVEDTLADGKTVTITVNTEVGGQTRVSMGEKNGSVYPMSFDTEEHLYLREVSSAEKSPSHYASSSYKKIDAHTGSFTFDVASLTAEATYDYVAVYPCHPTNYKTSLENGVRYGGTDLLYRCSYQLSYNRLQVPTATAPDDSTHLYWATDLGKSAQAKKINLALQPLVGYGKMTLKNFPKLAADETASKITITAPSDKIMTGRLFKYFTAKDTYKYGDVTPYSKTTVKNYVLIDPKNITFNDKGFDIWFTTFPFSLAKDAVLSFEITTNKGIYSFTRTISKALSFTEGCVSEFTIDYTKCSTD